MASTAMAANLQRLRASHNFFPDSPIPGNDDDRDDDEEEVDCEEEDEKVSMLYNRTFLSLTISTNKLECFGQFYTLTRTLQKLWLVLSKLKRNLVFLFILA